MKEDLTFAVSASSSIQDRARALVDLMAANGAVFSYKPAEGSLPASFTYEQPRGADRWRCREIVAEAKADPALWAELVAEIGRRCGHGGAP